MATTTKRRSLVSMLPPGTIQSYGVKAQDAVAKTLPKRKPAASEWPFPKPAKKAPPKKKPAANKKAAKK